MLLKEIWRHPQGRPRNNPVASVPLVLQHPEFTGSEDDWFAEPMVQVEFSVSPSDPAVGWRGGADEIVSVTAEEDFSFMGRRFQAGQEIPQSLYKFWSPSRGYQEGDVEEYLLAAAEEEAGGDAYDDDGDYEYDRRRDEDY